MEPVGPEPSSSPTPPGSVQTSQYLPLQPEPTSSSLQVRSAVSAMKAMRISGALTGPMGETPSEQYGGMSEKDYLHAYFPHKIDIYCKVITGFLAGVWSEVEKVSFQGLTDAPQSQHGAVKAAVACIVAHKRLKPAERPSKAFRLVARQLAIRSKDTPYVNANTIISMKANQITSEVYRVARTVTAEMRIVPEVFSPLAQAIFENVGPDMAKGQSTYDIDISAVVKRCAELLEVGDGLMCYRVRPKGLQAYINAKLDGMSEVEALRASVNAGTGSVAGDTTAMSSAA